jgi:hypothetical protein
MSELRLYRPDACTGCDGKIRQKEDEDGECQDERTMLPGLSTTMNSRSLSCRRILTGVDVTGGSWRWTTFLRRVNLVSLDQTFRDIYSLDTVSVIKDSIWFRYFSVDGCDSGFQCIPLGTFST